MGVVSGRLTNSAGVGIGNVNVVLWDSNKVERYRVMSYSVATGGHPVGYYEFPAVALPFKGRVGPDAQAHPWTRRHRRVNLTAANPDALNKDFDMDDSYDDAKNLPDTPTDSLDVSYVKAVLSAAQEIVERAEETHKTPTQIRQFVQNFVFCQLAKNDAAGNLESVDCNVLARVTSLFPPPPLASAREQSLADQVIRAIPCVTCRDRYYSPGTIYYMNYTLYVQCLNGPCT